MQDKEENSGRCNFQGTFECGICNCNPGIMGEFCDCSVEMMFDTSSCRAQNSQKDCSGRGTCSCGQCSCYHRNNPYEVSFTSFHLNQAIFILVFMRWLINTLYIISLTIDKPNFSNPQKNETRNYGILDLYIFHLFRFFLCVWYQFKL